jgi:ribosomal protein S18 acetylase RimI-like enzyme
MPDLLVLMQEYYAHDDLEFNRDAALAALGKLLAEEAFGCAWLIERDGRALGYIVLTFGYSLEFGGRDAFIDELYIQEAYRGCGVGTETLELAESAARSMGIAALHLEVDRDNRVASRFYRRSGFEDRARFRLMSKRL